MEGVLTGGAIGQYEFVRKGDPPVMGITKVTDGVMTEQMRRARVPLSLDTTADRLPASASV